MAIKYCLKILGFFNKFLSYSQLLLSQSQKNLKIHFEISEEGGLVTQWVNNWPTDLKAIGLNLAEGGILSIPLHTAFH